MGDFMQHFRLGRVEPALHALGGHHAWSLADDDVKRRSTISFKDYSTLLQCGLGDTLQLSRESSNGRQLANRDACR